MFLSGRFGPRPDQAVLASRRHRMRLVVLFNRLYHHYREAASPEGLPQVVSPQVVSPEVVSPEAVSPEVVSPEVPPAVVRAKLVAAE